MMKFSKEINRAVPRGGLAGCALLVLTVVTCYAQQTTGTPGSPDATTTIDGTYLPPPPPKFGGKIGLSADDSKPYWPPTVVPPKGAPNVLLIMTDDAGYGVAGTFGGVIPTPALDRIASMGLRYTQFHSTALCSPTRAALITGRDRLDGLDRILDHGRQRERFEMKLHAPRLDLGEVENIVDQNEEVAPCAENAVEGLGVLLQRLGILAHHLSDADDGVERRAQLVAHIGEELRLVLARFLKLSAFFLDLVEQSRVPDSEHGLGRESLQELDDIFREFSRCLPVDAIAYASASTYQQV
jgi:Sulfatase